MTEKKRVKIYPASNEQMEKQIAAENDAELKKAYKEMLQGCVENPNLRDWYAMWIIENENGSYIGNLCYKGFEKNKNPEIGYGIFGEFQGKGYATEAVRIALNWAFQNPEVKAVEAETEPRNIASQKVLEKCGFKATGVIGEEGPRFILHREQKNSKRM